MKRLLSRRGDYPRDSGIWLILLGRGSYVGTGSGMLEMRFENDSFFRGKKVHVRLGVRDKVMECEE